MTAYELAALVSGFLSGAGFGWSFAYLRYRPFMPDRHPRHRRDKRNTP